MFWNKLIELCNSKGLKPNQVGKELGISSASFTKWKNGTMPNVEMLIKLAEFFNVSLDYLVFGTEISQQKVSNNEGLLITDKNECMLIQHYRALHYAKQIQVLYSVITETEKADDLPK